MRITTYNVRLFVSTKCALKISELLIRKQLANEASYIINIA